MDTLASYPYVLVRIRCRYCTRSGAYRLARLAETFGSEVPMEALLDILARDCAYRINPFDRAYKKLGGCGAYFPDLTGPPKPPDLPPMAVPLKAIQGGRK